jgi:hypothetical protein
MLGRLKLTVDQCLDEYRTLVEAMFAYPREAHVWNKPESKFDYRNVENVMDQVVEKYKLPDMVDQDHLDPRPWKNFKEQSPTDGRQHCKT